MTTGIDRACNALREQQWLTLLGLVKNHRLSLTIHHNTACGVSVQVTGEGGGPWYGGLAGPCLDDLAEPVLNQVVARLANSITIERVADV